MVKVRNPINFVSARGAYHDIKKISKRKNRSKKKKCPSDKFVKPYFEPIENAGGKHLNKNGNAEIFVHLPAFTQSMEKSNPQPNDISRSEMSSSENLFKNSAPVAQTNMEGIDSDPNSECDKRDSEKPISPVKKKEKLHLETKDALDTHTFNSDKRTELFGPYLSSESTAHSTKKKKDEKAEKPVCSSEASTSEYSFSSSLHAAEIKTKVIKSISNPKRSKKNSEKRASVVKRNKELHLEPNEMDDHHTLKSEIETEMLSPQLLSESTVPGPSTKVLVQSKDIINIKANENLAPKIQIRGLCKILSSHETGKRAFEKFLYPIPVNAFLRKIWEEQHLLIKGTKHKFRGLFSTSDIDRILRKNSLQFTKNVDVTSYKNGVRETYNPEGRAFASQVWDYYNRGCSVRLLNPQTFHTPVWKLLTMLQEFFNSFCGANVYLTPPGTQGFAPHWDDIEAFIVQLEGKKRWRVYKPRIPKEVLPRTPSRNFGPDDPLGLPILDTVLEPGDVLYFPRGFIHQGEALDDSHSLHITISTYQKNSWVDFLEKLLPMALEKAAEEAVAFRKGLPPLYMYSAGIAFNDLEDKTRRGLINQVRTLLHKMVQYAPINEAVDQMAKGFVYDALPPALSQGEKLYSVFEEAKRWCPDENTIVDSVEFTPETHIRLIRKGCVRLLVEEKTVRLFYSTENSREYHADEPKYLELAADIIPGVKALIRNYPEYTAIEDLPLLLLEDKMTLAVGLWEKGIVTTFS